MCGPSGVGKSTLITRLRAEFPHDFGFSVSHTTRQPRPGEENGVHYWFVTKEEMQVEIAAGKFLESACVHGNYYGTSFASVRHVAEQGRVCILDIDVQGVASCRKAAFDVDKYVFIAPPDVATLEARLRGRGTETEETVQKRLANAGREIAAAAAASWDAWVVNDDLDQAYAQLKALSQHARQARAAAQKQ